VEEIALMRSRTEADGARYARVAAVALTGAD
jgi:2'-5' RNA ligase